MVGRMVTENFSKVFSRKTESVRGRKPVLTEIGFWVGSPLIQPSDFLFKIQLAL